MTLIRLVQRAGILAGITFSSFPFLSTPAHADTPQICVIASNGKTVCGTLKAVERACVTTDGSNTICGKFQSASEGKEPRQEEARNPKSSSGYRKEVDNFVFTLDGCKRVGTEISCQVSAKNKGKERTLTIYAQFCTFVESSGKSHPGSKIDVGRGLFGSSTVTIAPDSEFSTTIIFENVSQQITKAQLLNVAFQGGLSNKPVQFKNIPVSN
jgi:hypothetical protein